MDVKLGRYAAAHQKLSAADHLFDTRQPLNLARAKVTQARALSHLGQLAEAHATSKAAIELIEQANGDGDASETLAAAWCGLCETLMRQGSDDATVQHAVEQAMRHAQTPLLQARALNFIGMNNIGQGEYRQAIVSFERVRALRVQIEDVIGLASAELNIGVAHKYLEQYDAATEAFASAWRTFSSYSYQSGSGMAAYNLADCANRQARYADAATHDRQRAATVRRCRLIIHRNAADQHARLRADRAGAASRRTGALPPSVRLPDRAAKRGGVLAAVCAAGALARAARVNRTSPSTCCNTP